MEILDDFEKGQTETGSEKSLPVGTLLASGILPCFMLLRLGELERVRILVSRLQTSLFHLLFPV